MIPYDVDTRWNSSYLMIGTAIECQKALIQLVRDNLKELEELAITPADWTFLQQLYDILSPFNEYTRLVSEGRSTITTASAIYFELNTMFKAIADRDDEYSTYPSSIFKCS
jgi:hypothetical protein